MINARESVREYISLRRSLGQTEVPASDLLAYRYQRPIPFIYTEDEIQSIML